jgi:hypothetical protein
MDLMHPSRWCSIFLPRAKGVIIPTVLFDSSLTHTFNTRQRVYADANLYNPDEFVVITESADQILGDLENKARDLNITLPSNVELVLEIVSQDSGPICGYYFVEHRSRCLFWLKEFDAEGICDGNRVVVSSSHLGRFGLQ